MAPRIPFIHSAIALIFVGSELGSLTVSVGRASMFATCDMTGGKKSENQKEISHKTRSEQHRAWLPKMDLIQDTQHTPLALGDQATEALARAFVESESYANPTKSRLRRGRQFPIRMAGKPSGAVSNFRPRPTIVVKSLQ
jgi:hypothetical protein